MFRRSRTNLVTSRARILRESVRPCVEALEERWLLSTPPNGPFGMTAIATSPTSVQLSFIDNASNETGFVIDRATSATGPFTQVASLPASPGTLATVQYTDNTAVAGTQYFYFAQALNGTAGSSDTNVASATTPTSTSAGTGGGGTGTTNPGGTPNGPFALNVAATAPTSVQLSFIDNSSNETGFVIQRSTAGAAFTTITTLAPAAGIDSTVL